MTVFVDTSALYAIVNASDGGHEQATAYLRRHLPLEDHLSSSYVVLETTTLVQRRMGLPAVRRLVDEILPALDVIWVAHDLHLTATAAMLAAGQRKVSLVDWVSFTVMRTHGIDDAFAFDEDFRSHGFHTVP